jgi:hypothetical protein
MAGTGTVTVDIALLILLSSQIAQWAKVYIDAKNMKRANLVALKAEPSIITTVATPPCSQEMMQEHIAKLTTHTVEIAGLKDSLAILRTENNEGHDKIESKLDKILMTAMRNGSIHSQHQEPARA